MSYLYRLDIDTGKSEPIAGFPAHKNLNNVVSFDAPMGIKSITAAYDKSVIKVSYPTSDPASATHEMM